MRSLRVPSQAAVAALLLALALTGAGPARAQRLDPNLLVYHQITNLTGGTGSIGFPVLSADGRRVAFFAPDAGDAATPNRIYAVGADGTGLTEVDAYKPGCDCNSEVDISADGGTVVSTDSSQVRLVAAGGAARELVSAGNEITALRITGDGRTVFFVVRRDTSARDGGRSLPRGIWAINADGSDLRQVVGAEAVAKVVGVPVEDTGCCFHAGSESHALDVSQDGSRVVFTAYAHGGEYGFAVAGGGGTPRVLVGPDALVERVAISGDGATIAADVVPLNGDGSNQIAVVPYAGGEGRIVAKATNSGTADPIQLSADGSRLLVSPNSLLIDTATGEVRTLEIALAWFSGNHDSVLTDGLPRATMNADATRFAYAMRTARCADCLNAHEQLAILDLGPADLGAAPVLADPRVSPGTIALSGASVATVQVHVATAGKVRGVGLVALANGVYDGHVGWGVLLTDDGTNGDATAGDGTFTNDAVRADCCAVLDPHTLRIEAEVETSDGLRHAKAVDFGPLMVVAS